MRNIDQIRDALTFADIFRYFNETAKATCSGEECQRICPLPDHIDKTPSFSFNEKKKVFNCFGCEGKGDVIDLVAILSGYNLKQNFGTVLDLSAQIAGVVEDNSTETFEELYLSAEKKEGPEEEQYAKDKAIHLKDLKIEWKIDEYSHDVMIPLRHPSLSGSVTGAQRGKKRFLAGSKQGFFYEKGLLNETSVYLVEGMSDWLSMISAGKTNTIGLASAMNDTKKLTSALKRFNVVKIALDLDKHKSESDNSGNFIGAKKTLDIIKQLKRRDIKFEIYTLGLEERYDINDLWKKGGVSAIEDFFKRNRVSFAEFNQIIGKESKNTAYEIAKNIIKEMPMTVDSKLSKFLTCDRLTNVWSPTTREEAESNILFFIEDHYDIQHSSALILDIMKYIARLTSIENGRLRDTFTGRNTFDINDKENAAVLLKTGKLYIFGDKGFVNYKRTDYAIDTLGVDYDENYKPLEKNKAVWDKFLNDLFEGDSDKADRIKFIQEWFGYSIIPKNNLQKILFIKGGGGNGKSVLLNCLIDIIGQDRSTSIEVNELTNNRFITSTLTGAYINVCTDLSKKSRMDSDMLKKISGGDVITVEAKFQAPMQIKPFVKFVIASNNEPYSADAGDWLTRRLQIIKFNNSFIGREDISLEENLRKIKQHIFLWSLEGARRLLENKQFTIPASVQAENEKLISAHDYIKSFNQRRKNNLTPAGALTTNVFELYAEFVNYMEVYEGKIKQYIYARRTFVEEMIKAGYSLGEDNGIPHLRKKESIDGFEF